MPLLPQRQPLAWHLEHCGKCEDWRYLLCDYPTHEALTLTDPQGDNK